jgi:soluble lytic murein transglycosylase-like protein
LELAMRYIILIIACFNFNFLSAASINCNRYIAMQEKTHGIPLNLLKAISLVESGKNVNGSIISWPWTINVEGKGYLFKTKSEAIKAVRMHKAAGRTSIDVGPMQINLKHHPHAFKSLEEAFDPQINIAYGAKFLKELYEKCGSWNTAVAYYHSASPKFHNIYKKKVLGHWSHLCKSYDSGEPNQLAQTVLKFDDAGAIKSTPQTAIKPYAKVKRTYYSIDGSSPNLSKQTYVRSSGSEVSNGRMYYSLD